MNRKNYAIKVIPKFLLYTKARIFSNLNEPRFLKRLIKYNFVPKIISSFQDYDFLYLVTSIYEGKSLKAFSMDIMTEEQIKFSIACIIQGLEYLRKKNIIHRDLAFSNVIMDKDSYFNLIDFSTCMDYYKKNEKNFFMIIDKRRDAPEIVQKRNYDFNSDYFRLGGIIFFLIYKKYPLINSPNIKIKYKEMRNYSYECFDFMNKLLIANCKKRIGFKDINELKNHSWFEEFDWIKLKNKKIISPFRFITSQIKNSKCTRLVPKRNELTLFTKYSKSKN